MKKSGRRKSFKDTRLRDELWEKTGWGKVASWYDETVKKASSSQKEVILPELLRFFPTNLVANKRLLDLGCGTGFFLKEYLKAEPAMALGLDLDEEILELARENLRSELKFYNSLEEGKKKLGLLQGDASNLHGLGDKSFDFVMSIESITNMRDLKEVVSEVYRVLDHGGKFFLVMNHPSFRVPQSTDWYFDSKKMSQGRVIFKYKTAHTIKIDMNPGSKKNKVFTYTYHRPLEEYFNTFKKAGFQFSFMKEVISSKISQKGKRKDAEDTSRKEIPMFLFLEWQKN